MLGVKSFLLFRRVEDDSTLGASEKYIQSSHEELKMSGLGFNGKSTVCLLIVEMPLTKL